MAPVYKISVIQLYIKPLDPEHNHAKAISSIQEAASQSCHLVVLPEYHLTGWLPSSPQFAPLCASMHTTKYLSAYQDLARSLHINIVPGTIVETLSSGELVNIAYFISSTGEILGRYQKKNLWHPERPHLTSSNHERHLAFDTPLGKVGLLICWDLAFPEAFRELIAQGAKMIIVPSFWGLSDCTKEGLELNPLSEELFLDSVLVARAFENTVCVVFVNAGGPKGRTKEGSYAGVSQVVVPFKGALGRLGREEGSSVVEVDMDWMEQAERNYGVRRDMEKVGWHYDYTLWKDGREGKESKL